MADERKKKLEEIKKRKEQLKQMMNKTAAGPEQPAAPKEQEKDAASNEIRSTISSTSSSEAATAREPKSYDKRKSKNTFFNDPVKSSKLMEIHIKKINESLREERINLSTVDVSFKGIHPDVKDQQIQYELPKEFEDEKMKEELLKKELEKMKKAPQFARRSSVVMGKEQKLLRMAEEKKRKESAAANSAKTISEEKYKQFVNVYGDRFCNFYNDYDNPLEQALCFNDIMDISGTYYNEEETDVDISKRTLATHSYDLHDEQANGRIVTALDWSETQQDLFLASFNGTENYNLQSGLIQLWSLSNRKKPDYVINYQTELTSALFYQYNPKIVFGGSFTGQIVMWDIKEKPVPVQKSPLGIADESSHCYPIYCLSVIGNENNCSLISISSDGVLCEWNLANLSKPLTRINLNQQGDKEKSNDEDKCPLCVGTNLGSISAGNPLSSNFAKNLIIGCDDSNIYHFKYGGKDYMPLGTFRNSGGPVFCIDPHRHFVTSDGRKMFSDLFLSCGADWTAKLWSTSQTNAPLLTFSQAKDYIYSVKWHPLNPSIFATADGSGILDFYDLNRDREMPYFRYDNKSVINKIAWSHDGKKLAAGDVNGKISIFSAEKDVYTAKNDDIMKFEKIINNIKANSQ